MAADIKGGGFGDERAGAGVVVIVVGITEGDDKERTLEFDFGHAGDFGGSAATGREHDE